MVNEKGTSTGGRVRIERAHLEEDAGKSNHDESGRGGDYQNRLESSRHAAAGNRDQAGFE